jgi:hypothetical protein
MNVATRIAGFAAVAAFAVPATSVAAGPSLSQHAAWYAMIQNLNIVARGVNAEMGVAPIVSVSADCVRRLGPSKWACDGYLYYKDAACNERYNDAIVVKQRSGGALGPQSYVTTISVNWTTSGCVRS